MNTVNNKEESEDKEKIILKSVENIKEYYKKEYRYNSSNIDLINYIVLKIVNKEAELDKENKFKIFLYFQYNFCLIHMNKYSKSLEKNIIIYNIF